MKPSTAESAAVASSSLFVAPAITLSGEIGGDWGVAEGGGCGVAEGGLRDGGEEGGAIGGLGGVLGGADGGGALATKATVLAG